MFLHLEGKENALAGAIETGTCPFEETKKDVQPIREQDESKMKTK